MIPAAFALADVNLAAIAVSADGFVVGFVHNT